MAEAPVAALAARSAQLADDPLDPEQVISGDPRTASAVIVSAAGGESGIWRCTQGSFSDVEADETFVVLEGRATIAWDGGEIEVGTGDVCTLAAGTETVWTVHETLLKGFRIDQPR